MSEVLSPSNGQISPRIAFLREEGFALYTDVNTKVVDAIEAQPVPGKIRYKEYLPQDPHIGEGLTEANLALRAVVSQFASHSRPLTMRDDTPLGFYRRFGIGPEDEQAAFGNSFLNGFGDREFPWYFSAGLANTAVEAFVEDDRITREEASSLTLGDWANVIGSGWFSRLAHTFAFTSNGVYAQFGKYHSHYRRGALLSHLNNVVPAMKDADSLLTTDSQFEAVDNTWYLTASLHPDARTGLREQMRIRGSVGCPVARRSAYLSSELVETNPHVAGLVNSGRLTIKPQQTGDKQRVEQADTAIDRTLILIANQLDLYDRAHGTPVVAGDHMGGRAPRLRHVFLEPTNVLKRAA